MTSCQFGSCKQVLTVDNVRRGYPILPIQKLMDEIFILTLPIYVYSSLFSFFQIRTRICRLTVVAVLNLNFSFGQSSRVSTMKYGDATMTSWKVDKQCSNWIKKVCMQIKQSHIINNELTEKTHCNFITRFDFQRLLFFEIFFNPKTSELN